MAVLKYKDQSGNFISLPNNLIAPYVFESTHPYNASTNPAATVQSITARLTGTGFEQKVADAIYDALGITPQEGKEHNLTEAIVAAVAEALENAFSTSESHTTAELALQTQISDAVAKAVEQALNTSGAQTPELVTAIESVVEAFLADTDKFIAGDNVNIAHDTTDHTITISATYSAFTGADGSTAGASGLVPAPAAADNTKFLKGDGTWQTPPDNNTTYTFAEGTTAGAFSVTPSGGAVQSVSIHGIEYLTDRSTHTDFTNVPITYNVCVITRSSAIQQTLALSNTLPQGRELHIIIVASGANAVVGIPFNGSTWIDCNEATTTTKTLTITSGKYGEINIINGGITDSPKYYVRYIGE